MQGQYLSHCLGIGRELMLAAAFPFRVYPSRIYIRDLFFYVVVSCGLAAALLVDMQQVVLLPNRNTGYQR